MHFVQTRQRRGDEKTKPNVGEMVDEETLAETQFVNSPTE